MLFRFGTALSDADVLRVCHDENVRESQHDSVLRTWRTFHDWFAGSSHGQAPADLHAEVALCFDPQTGAARVLGTGIGREYEKHGKRPNEIAGTADLVIVMSDRVLVYDWKTGSSPLARYRWQLRGLGCMAARAYARPEASWFAVKVGEGACEELAEYMDREDLEGAELEMCRVWSESTAALPVLRPGPHCSDGYCRARKTCTAFTAWRER